jgi:hypothetical protein
MESKLTEGVQSLGNGQVSEVERGSVHLHQNLTGVRLGDLLGVLLEGSKTLVVVADDPSLRSSRVRHCFL